MWLSFCKSVAKATEVRILDPPRPGQTAPDQRKRRPGAVHVSPTESHPDPVALASRVGYVSAFSLAIIARENAGLVGRGLAPDRRLGLGSALPEEPMGDAYNLGSVYFVER